MSFGLLFIATAGSAAIPENRMKVTFCRDQAIYITDLSNQSTTYLGKGYTPNIAPDGDYIAVTNDESGKRNIAIYDLLNQKRTVLDKIPSDNCFGPLFSSDGQFQAFQIINRDAKSEIGVVDKSGAGFRVVSQNAPNDCYAPVWLLNKNQIIFHDMKYIYIVNLNGDILRREKISDIFDEGISSSTRFLLSKDEKYWVYPMGVYNEDMLDLGEQPEALFSFNIITKQIKRLTPKGLSVSEPTWTPDGLALVFEGKKENEGYNIYQISATGDNLKEIIKDGRYPSVAVK